MLAPSRPLCQRLAIPVQACQRFSSNRKVKEHDVLFLRQQGAKYPKWHLTSPLRPGSRVKLSYGASMAAEDLIGRQLLDVVHDSGSHKVVLYEPTLSSYVINSERLATPIYPHDANTIVSLLDLTPSRPGEGEEAEDGQPFEIFEAGTGMGSLTLHIARAMHAANPPMRPELRLALCEAKPRRRQDPSASPQLDLSPDLQAALDAYKASRRAVLVTLDRNGQHLDAAHKLVRNFRRAQYLPSIDFVAGSISDYLSRRLAQSAGKPFLSRAVLDLPSAHEHAAHVVEALQPNGLLVVFTPSISQIAEFHDWAKRSSQPLRFEKVLELPVSTTSDGVHDAGGGRHWDVRTVVPRDSEGVEGEMVQVMRPKVGDRVAGGGFISLMRRWPAREAETVDGIVTDVEGKPQKHEATSAGKDE
ncbi:tRNA -methyltransferase [Drechmeria coniospora]|uniref:tRNA (adenine(58)-N(1))-methyltransferase catalytic subunit TRM61 n=1 Tax=Drechmeria coniospora TaxID=98403 RepID=A0A151GJ59_DRECN|nr:tRNA -methyltransferase [Drechmeria coniospora]KYK57071.1 tRNA -methyltransferase [Drechmeria coniospora]